MEKVLSIVQAKSHFSDCVRSAEHGSPVVITRHGKPVVAVVPAEDLERLNALRAGGPQSGLAGLAGGWEGSEELVEILAASRRGGSRDVPDLD